MKKLTLLAAVSITVLFTISISTIDFSQTDDAVKSKGNSLPETGSDKVCGDQLCSKVNSQHKMKQSDSMTHVSSMDMMMEKMDEIHENHKQKMMQSWNSMTNDEQSQMHHQMKMMMEKMESMDMNEHMKMMSSMDGKDHDKMMHDNSEKYKAADHLAMQHLETFDELDFEMFTNQNWEGFKESHSEDITVHWPDGSKTEGLDRHIKDLEAMFVYAPDTRIQEHPVRIASGEWTSVIGIMEGTFTEPMPLPDGSSIPPTGKAFKVVMNTVGHWNEDGVMDEEYLFWDNLSFMKQIGLSE